MDQNKFEKAIKGTLANRRVFCKACGTLQDAGQYVLDGCKQCGSKQDGFLESEAHS